MYFCMTAIRMLCVIIETVVHVTRAVIALSFSSLSEEEHACTLVSDPQKVELLHVICLRLVHYLLQVHMPRTSRTKHLGVLCGTVQNSSRNPHTTPTIYTSSCNSDSRRMN